ncbi:MAG: endonuclease domain-containing protein [Bacteroidota bacterium]
MKERAKWLRKNMTLAEVLLWKRIKGKQMLEYDFDRQKPLDEFIVDFYCRELRLAIEVDGRSHDQKGAFEKDENRQKRLESLGVQFLRFRDYELLNDIENVLSEIEGWIKKQKEDQSIR